MTKEALIQGNVVLSNCTLYSGHCPLQRSSLFSKVAQGRLRAFRRPTCTSIDGIQNVNVLLLTYVHTYIYNYLSVCLPTLPICIRMSVYFSIYTSIHPAI